MRNITLGLAALFLSITLSAQTTHTIEVGGGSGVTPYYEPQFITIEVGDDVLWDCVTGFHNVTSTSGPESFSHPSQSAPWQFTHTFTIAGEYDFECSVGNHSATQFGTITVVEPTNIATYMGEGKARFYPNPSTGQLFFEGLTAGTELRIFDLSGKQVALTTVPAEQMQMNLSAFPAGMYFVALTANGKTERKRLILE